MPGEQAKRPAGPQDKIEDHLAVDAGADLTALQAALPHHAGRIATHGEEALAKEREKLRVTLAFGEKLAKDPAERTGIERNHRLQLQA